MNGPKEIKYTISGEERTGVVRDKVLVATMYGDSRSNYHKYLVDRNEEGCDLIHPTDITEIITVYLG